jgi:hypothetical protein
MTDPCLQNTLAGWISRQLRRGIVLTDAVARFMESTFGCDDPAHILSQTDDSEADSLLELLCYPDTKVQISFESRWGERSWTLEDLAAVIGILCAAPLQAPVTSPSGQPLETIALPPFALETFVRRLNITRCLPARLAEATARCARDDRKWATRVRLRHAALSWHEGQIELVARFLDKMPVESPAFDASLDFLISIMSELMPAMDAYEFLAAKKFMYFHALCRAQDFERQRLASNMETLILQGARAACGSIAEWRLQMQHIDLICRTLYGRAPFFHQPVAQNLEVEATDTPGQIQEMMRLLG